MIGRLEECHLLSYAVPVARARVHVPRGLECVSVGDSAFLNIVVCRVDRMRPAHAPRLLGATYWHVAYRLQVRARLADGRAIEGLYFLRSDVDRRLFGAMGNVFTDFRFWTSRVQVEASSEGLDLRIDRTHGAPADARLSIRRAQRDGLVAGSCFASIAERDAKLRYMPFGLSVASDGRRLCVAEVHRDESAWREEPVEVVTSDWPYARHLGFDAPRLERAIRVATIDYRWRLGRRETLAP
jgi:uncharacterized protein YqjF (DUF2071 family)